MFYGLFIGAGVYRDARIPAREAAKRDAEAMHAAFAGLLEHEGAGRLTVLTNERATKDEIASLLTQDIPRDVTPADTCFVYLSGTGCLELPWAGAGPSMLFLSHDSDYDNLRTGSLDMVAEVSAWLRRIDASVVTLVVDASFAGGAGSRTFDGPSYRATIRTRSRCRPRWSTLPLGPRCTLVGACADDEPACEDPDTERGVFTEQLLRGVAKARVRPSALTPAFLHEIASAGLRARPVPQTPVLIGKAADAPLFPPPTSAAARRCG